MTARPQSVLKLQARVLFALVLREARGRFGRTRLGYVWAVLEPLAFITVSTGLFIFLGRRAPVGDSLFLFFVVGFLPFLLFRGLCTRLTRTIDSADGLLTFPLVKPPDVVFAKIILEVATMCVVALIIAAGIWYYYGGVRIADPLSLAGAMMTTILLGAGIGMINAIIVIFMASWDRVFAVLFRVAYALSGVYTITDRLPEFFRSIVVWSPINHCVEWVRTAFFPGYECQSLDRAYPLICAIVLIAIGLSAERALRPRVLST
jgi:capsular polysaccharide transport system permease protein